MQIQSLFSETLLQLFWKIGKKKKKKHAHGMFETKVCICIYVYIDMHTYIYRNKIVYMYIYCISICTHSSQEYVDISIYTEKGKSNVTSGQK